MGTIFKLQSSSPHLAVKNYVKKKSKEAQSCNHKFVGALENSNVSEILSV